MDLMWYQCYMFSCNPNRKTTRNGELQIPEFEEDPLNHVDFVGEIILPYAPYKGLDIFHVEITNTDFAVYRGMAYGVGRILWSAKERRYFLWGNFWEMALY